MSSVRWLALVLVIVSLSVLAFSFWLRGELPESLPQLEGERQLAGLSAPVTIERDALAVPTIQGANRRDVAFATGFLHAQDRFFQMDLQRRRAAGELSEVLGPLTVNLDSANRRHRFRDRARQLEENSSPAVRDLVGAYTAGVNAGLEALEGEPFEYQMLLLDPVPWQPEDSWLVLLGMFLQLQGGDGGGDRVRSALHDLLPEALYRFLTPIGTGEWDAPIVGEPIAPPPIPSPEQINLRSANWPGLGDSEMSSEPRIARVSGSNTWALAGGRTANGSALLANELHLDLSVPNIWYRASFVWPDGASGEYRVTGVTLPGAPPMVVGSNGHVAWGVSNSLVDVSDVIRLDMDGADPNSYLTPDGPRALERFEETIVVRGAPDRQLSVAWTHWGPVIDDDHRGRRRALRWIAHEEGAVDFEMLRLETARDLDSAVELAQTSGAPALNAIIADATGRVAWTLLGRLPRRIGFDGRLSGSWADGSRRWEGLLPPVEVPQVVDPENGALWSANHRMAAGEMLSRLGNDGYLFSARARQIRDRLLALEAATEEDMLAIQLDNRAIFLDHWQEFLLSVLSPEALEGHPRRREMRELVEAWQGYAAVDSADYMMVRYFRVYLGVAVFGTLTEPYREKVDPGFLYVQDFSDYEGPLWQLVQQQPLHLLDPRYETWDEQFLAVVDQVIELYGGGGRPLREAVWGQRNTSEIRHALSRLIPGTSGWLDMPSTQLAGDNDMPLVQHPDHGSTLRMVVSPGREDEGFFTMPGGQSGHPSSPHYRDGHSAWLEGAEAPFLPGDPVYTLRLVPAG